MNKSVPLVEYQRLFLKLLDEQQVLMLATLDQQQLPAASMTPFVFEQQALWVFVSQLSPHTDNLLQRPALSVLICDDIQGAANPFAIQRATIACRAERAGAEDAEPILAAMSAKLGETVSLLRQLPDFTLFKLKPQSGRFIAGFGKAFEVDFTSMSLQHITGNGS